MGYDYSYEYFGFPETMEGVAEGAFIGAAGVVTGIILLICFLTMAFYLVSYVLSAVGMYRIAKRRGIHHAWLAWVPVGNAWLLGSISDHYQYVVKQKVTKRRTVLLVLSLLTVVACIFMGIGTGVLTAAEIMGRDIAGSVLVVALMSIVSLAVWVLAIVMMVFCYIACFDLFRSSKPRNDVLFLVLSILFSVTLPFFVFACSGSDEGMPARRAPQPPVQPPCLPQDEPEMSAPAGEEIPVVETEIVEDPE